MTYKGALWEAMTWLADYPNTVFLGQSVAYPGTAMYGTLDNVPDYKRIELPVAEDMQMGLSIGLALQGYVPISLFPRFDFLLLATNQLVNHADRLPLMSDYRPRVIIRTSVGSSRPLDPQWQHKGDYTEAFRSMLKTVRVVKLEEPEQILPAYKEAYQFQGTTLLVEVADYLNEK